MDELNENYRFPLILLIENPDTESKRYALYIERTLYIASLPILLMPFLIGDVIHHDTSRLYNIGQHYCIVVVGHQFHSVTLLQKMGNSYHLTTDFACLFDLCRKCGKLSQRSKEKMRK